MGSVTHLPVVGRKITAVDYADNHVMTLEASDIEDALGYVPADAADAGGSGPITGAQVEEALGYTPADAANTVRDLLPSTEENRATLNLLPTDHYACYRLTNPALVTVVVPLYATVPVPVGARIKIGVEGAAGALIAPASGVTLINRGNKRNAAQGSVFELHHAEFNHWWLSGDVQ